MEKDFTDMARKLITLLREERMHDGSWSFPTILQVGDHSLSEERESDVHYLAVVLQRLFDDMPNLGHCEFRDAFMERTGDES